MSVPKMNSMKRDDTRCSHFRHASWAAWNRVLLSFLATGLASDLAWAEVQVIPQADSVRVEIDGKPFTDFILQGGEAMKPYLHPLRSATGRIVTRHFPMETVEGEPKDHPHQRGLWFAHERVNGVDFWNNEANYTTPIRGGIVVDE